MENTSPQQPKSTLKTIMMVVLGIVVFLAAVIGLIFVGVNSATRGVEEKATSIFNDLKAGEIERVYQESLFSSEMSSEEFAQTLGAGSGVDLTKAEFKGWTGKGFQNKMKYTYGDFTFPNGKTQTLTFEFIENEGELKLSGIVAGKPEME